MDTPDQYRPLTPETLAARLASIDAVAKRVGSDPALWTVREVGDGNLNLVFIVEGPEGAVVVKQALPYVRLVGDSWPLPLYRAFLKITPWFDRPNAIRARCRLSITLTTRRR